LQLERDRYEVIVAAGAISDVLIDIIQRHRIDVAVVGTHGLRGFRKLRMGSIAEEVFRTASCPVLTAGPNTRRAPDQGAIRHILYPVEFAPDMSKAATYAVSLAERYSATLTVMNVREDMESRPDAHQQFELPRKNWIEQHVARDSGLRNRISFELGFGAAAESILDFAVKEDVDLIVMSVRQLDPFMAAHLPKSDTAHALVSRAPCPVLTIR
jgi:nucleotide-binding universal stress UspA family protein